MYTLTEKVRSIIQNKPYALVDMNWSPYQLPWNVNKIAIGDVTVRNLLYANIFPDVIIYDGRSERETYKGLTPEMLRNYSGQTIHVENPAGMITDSLWNAVMKACRDMREGTRTKIQVKGEEDLSILPAIIHATNETIIFYGIPGKGMAYLLVDQTEKDAVMDMLWDMSTTWGSISE